ncbi:MAG: hypothetical protein VXW65_05425 [Pseudomonadota bacterium]|nr:hypothetical protein [Pseudomonadota bacterium]
MQQPEQVQPATAQQEQIQQPTNLEGWVFIDSSGTFKTAPRQTAAMAIDAMEQLGNRAIDELIKAQGLRLAKVRVVTDVLFVMGAVA